MRATAILLGVLLFSSAASEEAADRPSEPSVEILGVKIVRGMTEPEVRAAFPIFYCAGEDPVDPIYDLCSVSDGVPPGDDGSIVFKHGFVDSASRNWFIPEGAEPLEVLMMLNDLLTRLIGETHAACAKIETYIDQEPTQTIFALPEKVLSVQMHTMSGRTGVLFRESLRVNPVPDPYKTRGQKMQGDEWCAYIN